MMSSLHIERPIPWDSGEDLSYGWILLICLASIGSIANVGILALMRANEAIRKSRMGLLVTYLSVTDLVSSVLFLVDCTMNYAAGTYVNGQMHCVWQSTWNAFTILYSGYTLALIARVNKRLFGPSKPLSRSHIHKAQGALLLLAAAQTAYLVATPPLARLNSSGLACTPATYHAGHFVVFLVFGVIAVIWSLLFDYAMMLWLIHRSRQKLAERNIEVSSHQKELYRASRATAYFVVYAIAHLPFVCAATYEFATQSRASPATWLVCTLFIHLSAVFHPLLFLWINKDARCTLARIAKSAGDSIDVPEKPSEEAMLTLQRILDDADQRRRFGRFLRSEHSYENLEFWTAAQERLRTMEELELQNLKSSDRIQEAVDLTHQILERYIAHDAPHQVNIPSCTRERVLGEWHHIIGRRTSFSASMSRTCVENVATWGDLKTLLQGVSNDVFRLMALDSLTRFFSYRDEDGGCRFQALRTMRLHELLCCCFCGVDSKPTPEEISMHALCESISRGAGGAGSGISLLDIPNAKRHSKHLHPPSAGRRGRLAVRRNTISVAKTLLQMGFASVSSAEASSCGGGSGCASTFSPRHRKKRSLSVSTDSRRAEDMLDMIRCLTAPGGSSSFRMLRLSDSSDGSGGGRAGKAARARGVRPHGNDLTITVENERGFEFQRIETVPVTRPRQRSASCGDIPTVPTPVGRDRSQSGGKVLNPQSKRARSRTPMPAPTTASHGISELSLGHFPTPGGPSPLLQSGQQLKVPPANLAIVPILGCDRRTLVSRCCDRPPLTPKWFNAPPSLEHFV